MTYKAVVITGAAVEPVTLAEAKAQLRLESSFVLDDTYIESLISVARDRVEKYCNRYFTTQTVEIIFDGGFPSGRVDLVFPDLASVDQLSYIDSDGADYVVNSADYVVDVYGKRWLTPVSAWPAGATSYAVTVTTGAPVAFDGAKQAILMIVTDLYESRSDTLIGVSSEENRAVSGLLVPYRVNMGF